MRPALRSTVSSRLVHTSARSHPLACLDSVSSTRPRSRSSHRRLPCPDPPGAPPPPAGSFWVTPQHVCPQEASGTRPRPPPSLPPHLPSPRSPVPSSPSEATKPKSPLGPSAPDPDEGLASHQMERPCLPGAARPLSPHTPPAPRGLCTCPFSAGLAGCLSSSIKAPLRCRLLTETVPDSPPKTASQPFILPDPVPAGGLSCGCVPLPLCMPVCVCAQGPAAFSWVLGGRVC